jgi:hypothetical protein
MTEKETSYSVGDLEYSRQEDPHFSTQEEAEVHAIEISDDHQGPLGVWRDDDGELISIVFNRHMWRDDDGELISIVFNRHIFSG